MSGAELVQSWYVVNIQYVLYVRLNQVQGHDQAVLKHLYVMTYCVRIYVKSTGLYDVPTNDAHVCSMKVNRPESLFKNLSGHIKKLPTGVGNICRAWMSQKLENAVCPTTVFL